MLKKCLFLYYLWWSALRLLMPLILRCNCYLIVHSAGIQKRAGARMLMLMKFDIMGGAKK